MATKLRIVFNKPGDSEKFYYYRDQEVTPDVLRAHNFYNAESCVAFRNRFREQYPSCIVFIEDHQGNRLFEREAQPQPPIDDDRTCYHVRLDGFESSGLGFVVRPAVRPEWGRCWVVKASDIPSMAGRTDIECVYGRTQIEAAERAVATWGALAQPSPSPSAEAQDAAEAKRILDEFHKSQKNPGRIRPGNEY